MSKLSHDLKEEKTSSPVYRANTVRMLVDNILEANSKNDYKLKVSYFIEYLDLSWESKLGQGLEDGMLYMFRMIELLESSLEANSKNYKNPTLGYVFIMNNRRFIGVEAKLKELGPILGDDWLHKNTEKFQQNLELYLRSSWNKIVNLLKLDINQLEPSVAAELMKDKLFWFNEHFDETCNIQSEWSVCDAELREQIIKSIENILLPAYGSFIERFEKFLGKNAYKDIKYGIGEVQDQLKNLFLIRE
ncbi:exocyst complex component EXO70B1-like [Phaseolus vulgaris]|uniref:exocyst complex component EXO70B1-like n=1 Tax=Phaseolus vulgaris TaxID=3885 RepID=UPI0035CA5193